MAIKQAYQAYSLAIQTTPKTRQVVMLYKGVIRFLKQAEAAMGEKRVEERFNCLLKATRIITGLQSSLDFGSNDEVSKMAHTLHRFYTGINVRILSLNFERNPESSKRLCLKLIEEIQEMCDVWDNIDHTLATQDGTAIPTTADAVSNPVPHNIGGNNDGNVTFSA